MSAAQAEHESFAARLSRLFRAVRKDDGEAYTPREIAEAVTRRGDERGDHVRCSKSYMYALLNGQSEPSHALVQALAEVFDVELAYFSTGAHADELARDYELLAKLGEGTVNKVAHRMQGLNAEQIEHVLEFIDFEQRRSGDA